ncbi:MAG TPA: hypothetical protein VFR64_11640 [Methylomirabilota bacterium]|nr:hypothetical protein [Methylomirabilota bacterium]
MKKVLAGFVSVMFFASLAAVSEAQNCPPEVAKAKQVLSQKAGMAKTQQDIQAPRSLAGARGQDAQAPRGQDAQAPRGQAKDIQAPRSLAGARGFDSQAPRGQDAQAPRGQDAQAPRGQDAQAPRGQDAQAPRGQDAQAPRGQDAQAPRGQDAQAPRSLAGAKVTGSDVSKASTLIKEAEAACKAGDMKTAKSKAQSALTILR